MGFSAIGYMVILFAIVSSSTAIDTAMKLCNLAVLCCSTLYQILIDCTVV